MGVESVNMRGKPKLLKNVGYNFRGVDATNDGNDDDDDDDDDEEEEEGDNKDNENGGTYPRDCAKLH